MSWQDGMQLLQQGKTAEAVETLQAVVAAEASSFEGHLYLGMALVQAGRGEEGVAAIERAVTLNPGHTGARYNYGVVLRTLGRPAEAAQQFQAALEIDPNHAKAEQALAAALSQASPQAPAPSPPAGPELTPLGGEPEAASPQELTPPPQPRPKAPARAKTAAHAKSRSPLLIVGAVIGVLALVAVVVLLVLPRFGVRLLPAGPPGKGAAYYADGNVQGADKTELASLFTEAAQALANDPDGALTKIQQALEKDGDNANLYYLKAAAHGGKQQWAEMTAALEEGNRRPECYTYVTVTGYDLMAKLQFPHYARFRQVARDAHNGGEQGLLAARAMGCKVTEDKPVSIIGCLVGIAIVAITDDGLVKFYKQQGDTQKAGEWEQRLSTDRAWAQTAKDTLKTAVNAMPKELLATASGKGAQPTSEAEKQRLDQLVEDFRSTEVRAVTEVLATRPQ